MKQRTRKTSPTAEDLIMTREEALQVLKERMDYYEREKRMRAAIEVLVPEFAEKEDDRISQALCDIVRDMPYMQTELRAHGLTVERVLDYLEKQKEQPTNEEMLRTLRVEYEKGIADTIAKYEQKEQKSLNISAASEWLRKNVCRYMNSEYNEFHKCVEYDGSIDKERLINDFEEAMQKEQKPINQCNTHEPTLDEARKWNEAYEKGYSLGYENGRNEQKPSIFPPGFGEVRWNPIASVQQKPIFRVGDTIMAKDGTGIPQEMFYIERIEDGFYWEKDNTILISNQDEFQLVEPADNVSKDEYVKKFKALCDAYEIKLPNRAYDIYHLCDDLAKLFGNTSKQEKNDLK